MKYWIPTSGSMKGPDKKLAIYVLIGALAVIGLANYKQANSDALDFADAAAFIDNIGI